MSVDPIGGSPLFPYIFDRPEVGSPTPREQGADAAATEARRTADNQRQIRRAAERRARQESQQEKQLERLDIERALRERTINLADNRPVARGSIVDIKV